jgi:hypothetical protein
MNPSRSPHPIFAATWSFWLVGTVLYTYGLATGRAWATPFGALCWLASFGWLEALPMAMRRPEYTLSGVVGWLIWRLEGEADTAWRWLADAITLPVAVLIVYTAVALFGGWAGWALGLGWGALLLVTMHGHWRYMAGVR